MGRSSVIGANVVLRCPSNITIGTNVFIDGNVVLDAKGADSRIELHDSVFIGRNTILSCSSGTIETGNDVSIGPHCYIRAGLGPVKIGSSVTIGSNSVIISGNPGYKRTDLPMKHQIGGGRGVTIGDDVWIGVGASVIDGSSIGNGSVIGAGAVVVGEIPPMSIAAGVPAKVIDRRS